jgi:hypothetical protein
MRMQLTAEPLSRTDALDYTITVFSTVGFGTSPPGPTWPGSSPWSRWVESIVDLTSTNSTQEHAGTLNTSLRTWQLGVELPERRVSVWRCRGGQVLVGRVQAA